MVFRHVLCSLSTQCGDSCLKWFFWLDGFFFFIFYFYIFFGDHFNVLQSLEMSEVASCQLAAGLVRVLICTLSIKLMHCDFRLMTADTRLVYKTYAN